MKSKIIIECEIQSCVISKRISASRGYHGLATQLKSEIKALEWALENHSESSIDSKTTLLYNEMIGFKKNGMFNEQDDSRWKLKILDWVKEG